MTSHLTSHLRAVAAPLVGAVVPAAEPPTPPEGSRLLREELARPEYVQTWWQRLWQWIQDLFSGGPRVGGVSAASVLAVLGVLVAGVAAFVLWRALATRRARTGGASTTDGLTEAGVGASAYRERALAHLAGGRPREAYLDAFRALAAGADAAGWAVPSPRRTAGTLGRSLAAARPDHAADARAAAATFDAVRYGHADASADDVHRVLDLADRLRGGEGRGGEDGLGRGGGGPRGGELAGVGTAGAGTAGAGTAGESADGAGAAPGPSTPRRGVS